VVLRVIRKIPYKCHPFQHPLTVLPVIAVPNPSELPDQCTRRRGAFIVRQSPSK
jgi:hypothetical protein